MNFRAKQSCNDHGSTLGTMVFMVFILCIGIATFCFSLAVGAATYPSASNLTRILVEDKTEAGGWWDSAVPKGKEDPGAFAGQLDWSPDGALLQIVWCLPAPEMGIRPPPCETLGLELVWLNITVGPDNVSQGIVAADVATGDKHYITVMTWFDDLQFASMQLEDGRAIVFIFEPVSEAKAYLWSD